ncbi:8783_t:CDS:1, partial [Gigaspora margarita]
FTLLGNTNKPVLKFLTKENRASTLLENTNEASTKDLEELI